jgi:Putative metal-binding motif
MKRTTLSLTLALVAALGCGSEITSASKTGANTATATNTDTMTLATTGTTTETTSATGTVTTAASNTVTNAGTATAATDTGTTTGTGTGASTQGCIPSDEPYACACPGGILGFQFCEVDGTRYTVCVCPPGAGPPPPGGTTITVTQVLPSDTTSCTENGEIYSNGASVVCGSKIGECREGKKTCVNGFWSTCTGGVDPTPEICDNKDNDCNGVVDDLWDKSNDPKNCGGCGNVCVFSNATALCVAGNCEMGACDADYHDFNKDQSDGCEKICLSQTNGVRVCNSYDNDCDGKPDDSEWNLETDPKNCGACGNDCSFLNLGFERHVAVDACVQSKCAIFHCLPGWIDANNNPADGCEAPVVKIDGGTGTGGIGGSIGTGGSTAAGGSIGTGGVSVAGGSVSGGTSAGGSVAGGAVGTGGSSGSGGVVGGALNGGSVGTNGGAGGSGSGGINNSGGTTVSSPDAGVGGSGGINSSSTDAGAGGGGSGGVSSGAGSGGSGGSPVDAAVDANARSLDVGPDRMSGIDGTEATDGEVTTDGGVIYSPKWGEPPLSQGTITCTREGRHIRVEIALTGLLVDGLAGSPPISQAFVGAGIGADLDSCWTSPCYQKATASPPIVWSDDLALSNNNSPVVADGIQPTKFTPYVTTAAGERIYLGLRSWTIIGCKREGCGLCRVNQGETCEPELIEWGCIADATLSP